MLIKKKERNKDLFRIYYFRNQKGKRVCKSDGKFVVLGWSRYIVLIYILLIRIWLCGYILLGDKFGYMVYLFVQEKEEMDFVEKIVVFVQYRIEFLGMGLEICQLNKFFR